MNTPLTGACDDDNPCTENDACVDGACKGDGPDCDDDNPCTTDTCTLKDGCANTPNTDSCSDGDPCTAGDACKDGKCEAGGPKDCDDSNPCTLDTCDSNPAAGLPAGCTFTSVTGLCDDGDPCSAGDKCVGGVCKAGGKKDCDDGNPCTDDVCVIETG
ncbi:MAG: hypothetical protein ACPGU1_23350, partial [Myxococcota bacterium]